MYCPLKVRNTQVQQYPGLQSSHQYGSLIIITRLVRPLYFGLKIAHVVIFLMKNSHLTGHPLMQLDLCGPLTSHINGISTLKCQYSTSDFVNTPYSKMAENIYSFVSLLIGPCCLNLICRIQRNIWLKTRQQGPINMETKE